MTDQIASDLTTKITHSVIVVTPEMAQRWLSLNDNNRVPRSARILKYREDMEAGRWTFAGDPIQFGEDGSLQNGQHRLFALAEADVSGIAFLVIRGLSADAKKVMDQGAKRTAGDQLGMLGYTNANNLASAVKVLLTVDRGLLFKDNKKATAEIGAPAIEEWVTTHPTQVANYQLVCKAARCCEVSPAVVGASFFLFERIDAAEAITFLQALAYGSGERGNPINALDQRLRRIRRSRQMVPARDLLAMFIQSWNAHREGRQMSTIPGPRGGRWSADAFPEPK